MWRARLACFRASDLYWFDALPRDEQIEVMAALAVLAEGA